MDGVLYDENQTTLFKYPEGKKGNSYTIPASVTTIGTCAFELCTSFTSITIPNNVTKIDSCAFQFCRNLTAVTIGSGVTTIGMGAFEECTSLTSITIPANVTYIGQVAFGECTSLTSVTFATGSNLPQTGIDNNAFPQGPDGFGGNTLKTAYLATGGGAGTYKRTVGGSDWTKQ